MVFTFFCLVVEEKIKLKVISCSFEITYFFENPCINPLQRLSCDDFDPKIHTGSRP